jgi:hypothetical protein
MVLVKPDFKGGEVNRKEVFSTRELMAYLRISYVTVRRLVASKQLMPKRKEGRLFFNIKEVENYLDRFNKREYRRNYIREYRLKAKLRLQE